MQGQRNRTQRMQARIKNVSCGCIVLALAAIAPATVRADDAAAKQALDAFKSICEADDGTMWSHSLCGPMIIVDPATRRVWANQADAEGVLNAHDGIFIGELPPDIGVANTAVEWSGTRWSMVILPLPKDETAMRVLLAHESWHRVQSELGYEPSNPTCTHLATERGRVLLRLEMRALARALRSKDDSRWTAARDALAFRKQRHLEFESAAQTEGALDTHEAVAEYTGIRLGAGERAVEYAASQLDRYDGASSYVRSYAYATGPAYGLLLDERMPNWRAEKRAIAPPDLLAADLKVVEQPSKETLTAAAARYEGSTVEAEEAERAERERVRVADLTKQFTSQARVVLALRKMQLEFNPNRITPIEGLGNVYDVLIVRDEWGELTAKEGALISSDFKRVVLSAPTADGLSGPGWTLSLKPGFKLREKDGVFTLEESG